MELSELVKLYEDKERLRRAFESMVMPIFSSGSPIEQVHFDIEYARAEVAFKQADEIYRGAIAREVAPKPSVEDAKS